MDCSSQLLLLPVGEKTLLMEPTSDLLSTTPCHDNRKLLDNGGSSGTGGGAAAAAAEARAYNQFNAAQAAIIDVVNGAGTVRGVTTAAFSDRSNFY
eukprot:jgi/Chrzof1/7669/Cz02g32100.t1